MLSHRIALFINAGTVAAILVFLPAQTSVGPVSGLTSNVDRVVQTATNSSREEAAKTHNPTVKTHRLERTDTYSAPSTGDGRVYTSTALALGLATVGVTWTQALGSDPVNVSIRTHNEGSWSSW